MQQPELGKRLTALRKEKGLTQEELADKSRVSVRTIQRIEAGEVLPRTVTIRILLEALGESYTTFNPPTPAMKSSPSFPDTQRFTLLWAAMAGMVYLIAEIILGALDIAWLADEREWGLRMNAVYIGLTVVMLVSYFFFVRGFVALSRIFENDLLKVVTYLLIVASVAGAVLDMFSLTAGSVEEWWLPYMVMAIIYGALAIAFGVALIRLQDGMGELARVAGLLEIAMGCLLVTVVLFFFAYVVLIPAVVVEIVLLYRGYEYLSRSEPAAA